MAEKVTAPAGAANRAGAGAAGSRGAKAQPKGGKADRGADPGKKDHDADKRQPGGNVLFGIAAFLCALFIITLVVGGFLFFMV
ncbi:MAG: hypothetical protein FWE70_07135, partial [Oscillospiraceae bacterium]|nr:hypothetical protein [Oscillospiraceae bacterium]